MVPRVLHVLDKFSESGLHRSAMVREGSVKRKALGAAGAPAQASDKKVRISAPAKKVANMKEPKDSTYQVKGKAEKSGQAKRTPKATAAPIKRVVPATALKKSKASSEKAPEKAKSISGPTPVKLAPKLVPKSAPKAIQPEGGGKSAKSENKAAKAESKVSKTEKKVPKLSKESKRERGASKASAPAKESANANKTQGASQDKPRKVPRIHETTRTPDFSDEEAGEDAHLEGFSDEVDSEEEDEEDDALARRAAPSLDEVVRLPSSRDDAVVRQRLEQAKRRQAKRTEKEDTGVVYIGRLPHGFFEEQLKAYFSQFGDVRRVRVSRNKKTGHSKHYGFLEFVSREVAEIVVDTMNNYLLDGHLIQMALIPKEEVDPNLWIGANRKFRKVPTDRVERVRRSRSRTDEERHRLNQRLLHREAKRRAKLARAGIEYDFPGYQG